ncbi:MAG: hypothetical protein OXG26_14550 [Caldilineaceae bacterium]|nr:hypothetical protein [Caldilineaceae bacterium]MDE0632581.1 hypothetical protein [Caldilineaceae bacterium]
MSANEFEQEVHFGLENLTRVRSNVIHIISQDVDEIVRRSALTYECFGYYNAFEHLILRFIKFLRREQPTGPFSHREALQALDAMVTEYRVTMKPQTLRICLELMAFRHVATKIYGFLIDEAKLAVIVGRIVDSHDSIVSLVEDLLREVLQSNED